MAETRAHKVTKTKVAGKDAATKVRAIQVVTAIEIERGGKADTIRKAAERLKESGKPQRVLIVPQRDLTKAIKIMREAGVTGTVKNLSGSKHSYVGAQSSTPTHRPSQSSGKR